MWQLSDETVSVSPDRTRLCARLIAVVMAAIAALAVSIDAPLALHPRAMDQLLAQLSGKLYVLKTDVKWPGSGSEGVQMPMLDRKGWHFAGGGPVLHAGSVVQVTGVFNYAERGFFLELASESTGFGEQPITERARIRVRLTVEAPGTEPARQAAEATSLAGTILSPASP